MPGRMAEIPPVAPRRDGITRQRVDFPAGHAGPHARERAFLRLQHDGVYFAQLRVGLPQNDGARHIRAITAVTRPEIHRQEAV